MTDVVHLPDDTEARLRALAAAAAPAVTARADLAEVTLRRAAGARRSRRMIIGLGGSALVAVAVAAGTLPGGGAYFTVIHPSENMRPTIEVGDAVVLGKELVPARGDVVQAHLTHDGVEYDSIERIIGLPGDTVECPAEPDGSCGGLLINGSLVVEPYVMDPTAPFGPETVPAGQVFLLGDYRSRAVDAREIGPTDLEQITGVAVRVIRNGESLSIPGAPPRDAPGGGDRVDPADELPPAVDEPAE